MKSSYGKTSSPLTEISWLENPSQPTLSYEHNDIFTKDLEVRRELGNRASLVNRALTKRPWGWKQRSWLIVTWSLKRWWTNKIWAKGQLLPLTIIHLWIRVCLFVLYLFEQVEVLAAIQLTWTCFTHPYTHRGQPQHRELHTYSSRIVRGFFNVPQGILMNMEDTVVKKVAVIHRGEVQ